MPIINTPTVSLILSDLERKEQDVSAPFISQGETSLLSLQLGISLLFRVTCLNLMRLRLYSSEAARDRDLARPVTTRARAGQGILLELVSTLTLNDFELSPAVWNSSTTGMFAAVTNLEAVPASPTFSIEYWEF